MQTMQIHAFDAIKHMKTMQENACIRCNQTHTNDARKRMHVYAIDEIKRMKTQRMAQSIHATLKQCKRNTSKLIQTSAQIFEKD